MGRRKAVELQQDFDAEAGITEVSATLAGIRSDERHVMAQRDMLIHRLWSQGYEQAQIARLCNEGLPVGSPHAIGEDAVEKAIRRHLPRRPRR